MFVNDADWPVQPNLILHKGELVYWFGALKELLARHSIAGPSRRQVQGDPAAPNTFMAVEGEAEAGEQRPHLLNGRPLVYFIGPSDCLNTLKRCMGRDAHPPRFRCGYDWEHFENPEAAWARLEAVRVKPEGLVTDYYLSGGPMNGLKVVRQAQRVVPGTWTVLASCLAEEHIRGIMEGTSISPDLFFHCRNYDS